MSEEESLPLTRRERSTPFTGTEEDVEIANLMQREEYEKTIILNLTLLIDEETARGKC